MDEFVKAGAPADILYAAHPHIGTFKLATVRTASSVAFSQSSCSVESSVKVCEVSSQAGHRPDDAKRPQNVRI